MKEGKSFQISQKEVYEAYKAVKANKGAGGIDYVDFDEFEKDWKIDYIYCGIECLQVPISQNL